MVTRPTKNTRTRLSLDAIKYYRNLQYHRSTILEGVRLTAIRNFNHMTRIMTSLGMNTLADDSDVDTVSDLIFKEQGMNPDLNSRSILEFVTVTPWEMYCCLLYVELENYKKASKKDPTLRFDPLEEFFQSNDTTLQHLNVLRDKILHPGKQIPLDHAIDNFMEEPRKIHGQHYYNTVFQAQSLIDAYAAWLRSSLSELVSKEWIHAAKRHGAQGNDKLTKLQKAREILSYPLPQLGNEPKNEGVQTPFNLKTWYMLGLFRNHDRDQVQSYPTFIQKAKTDCMRMLMRSLVLSNEFVNLLDISKLRAVKERAELDAMNPFDLLVTRTTPLTEQQAQNLISPVRIGNALLAEPLRIYYQTVEEAPELRHNGIEEIAGPGPVPPALRHYRNIVFHVASDSIDPDVTESTFLSQIEEHVHSMSLLPHLIQFYMSVR